MKHQEFFEPRNWFYQAYYGHNIQRYWGFKVALNLLLQRNGTNIVETGTVRQKDDWGAGYSTVMFADYCQHYDAHITTVDVDGGAMAICKEVTEPYKAHVDYVVDDSLNFLKNYDKPIDLLYLDSLDFPIGQMWIDYGGPEGVDKAPRAELEDRYRKLVVPCQQHNLNELKLAYPNLHKDSIVLIDDYDLPLGGKARLTNEELSNRGWTCLIAHSSVLWIQS